MFATIEVLSKIIWVGVHFGGNSETVSNAFFHPDTKKSRKICSHK